MFFIAAALLLTTAGVFAGKAKGYFTSYTVYAEHSGTYYPLTGSIALTADLIPGAGTQAKLIGSATSTQYNLWGGYVVSGTTNYAQLVTTGF